jgi:predicted dehydrogenase
MPRRTFMKSAAVTGASLTILPGGLLAASPNNKLNVALIGTWGRAFKHMPTIADENVVALCDVDETHMVDAAKRFPKATKYVDWRKCLDQKNLDAVIICTTDHTHAFIANWAMNRGLHVYCEKPLANSVEEARVLRENYLKNKGKLATQVGTQRHADPNFDRVAELIRDGAIGTLTAAYAWGNRKLPKPGYLKANGAPPSTLHYDLWLGPAPHHPFNPGYFGNFKARPGTNCLNWNMYWDFGSGQVGDMGSHTMDLVWNAIDADRPLSAEAKGDAYNPDVTPVELAAKYQFAANDWRPPIEVSWHQGGSMPRSPSRLIDLKRIGHGAMFKGSRGFLIADFKSRILVPYGKESDLTYYKPRDKEDVAPPIGHYQKEWTAACKGDKKTSCDFDYAGRMIEMMMLGMIAYRAGTKIDYDAKTGRVTNSPKANALVKRTYRKGWTLNG